MKNNEKRKYMEHLKEIISNNYTTAFPESVQFQNQGEYTKTVREDKQTDHDNDSDHVIDDETDDVIQSR